MSYRYEIEREGLFTDEGQRLFLKIRDHAHELLAKSGAATMWAMIQGATGDSFQMIACVDRMVELGELRCVYTGGMSQDHVYVKGTEYK